MELTKVIAKGKEELSALTNLTVSGVVEISKKDDGWHIGVELIERRAIPDTQDLLGVYEVTLNDQGEIMTYERKKMRRRMDIETLSE